MRSLAPAGIFVVAAFLTAQPPARPSFDVASVKPNKPGDKGGRTENQGGRFFAANVTPRRLILNAYQLQEVQLPGGPGWIDSERFDIEATADPNTLRRNFPQMLQSLLAERFKLTVHTEKRELSIYALVLARADGRLGPKLRRTGCEAPSPADRPQSCGSSATGPSQIRAAGVTLTSTVKALAAFTQHVVVDRTNLSDKFDLELDWTPDQAPGQTSIASDGPSLFTALQEQLGLKLEPQKAPVEVLVIDRIERPAQN